MKKSLKVLGIFTVLLITVLNPYLVRANGATVPINITVAGKLIISDAESDNGNSSNVSTTKANTKLRIRTNLSSWQLVAQRSSESKNIFISYELRAGNKANLGSAKLNSILKTPTSLDKISSDSQTVILNGISKTAKERDPKNLNNYLELSQTLTSTNKNNSGIGNASVIYSLVSI